MAKILTFRNKGDAPSGQDFLTDENQTLSFRATEDGGISLGALSHSGFSDFFPDPRKDWSNQELADLFRVRQLLSGANVPVETDRGITDEGDPWFVFCHANGEVFIHLCRIDGMYLLDSPNVLRPLRGADFNELIADFTNQALPPRGADAETERRVIRLERGGKVRLHPSAMLAALIWTLFLASEELVLLAPEDPETNSDALLDFDGMFAVGPVEGVDIDAVFEDEIVDFAHLLRDGDGDASPLLPEAPAQMREALHQQGLTLHNNAFSMGLSTIAIAMGFMSETVLLDNQRKVLAGLKELGFSDYDAETRQAADIDPGTEAEGGTLLAMLAEFLGLDLSLNTELAEATGTKPDAAAMKQDLAHLTQDVEADVALIAVKTTAPAAIRDKGDPDEAREQASARAQPTPEAQAEIDAARGENALQAQTAQDTMLQDLMQALQDWPSMAEIQIGHLTFKTNASLSDEDAFALFDWISDTSDPNSNGLEFDDVAQRLIEFLEAKDGDIYFLKSNNGFVAIDITAQTGGETATLHWQSDDGRTISFVGLQADFEQFDMIA